ncbi:MAG: hypothetical protein ACREU6_18400, partial [Steroidobacteraceae bacterium]
AFEGVDQAIERCKQSVYLDEGFAARWAKLLPADRILLQWVARGERICTGHALWIDWGGCCICPKLLFACRNRKVVMSQLINPVVRFDFHVIRSRGKEQRPAADDFTSFLKSYIATWAGRAGVL